MSGPHSLANLGASSKLGPRSPGSASAGCARAGCACAERACAEGVCEEEDQDKVSRKCQHWDSRTNSAERGIGFAAIHTRTSRGNHWWSLGGGLWPTTGKKYPPAAGTSWGHRGG